MKFRADNITFDVSNVSLKESESGNHVSFYLTYLDNKKEFVLRTDDINGINRARNHKNSLTKQRSLFRLVRKDLKHQVLDWIYNASNEEMPFRLQQLPIRKPRKKPKNMQLSDKVEPKPLHLILKLIYFDKIIAGTKTVEYRDDTPFYRSRLLRDGKYRNYKTVDFQGGYHKTAKRMTVEIKKVELINGLFEIHLGKVLDRNF